MISDAQTLARNLVAAACSNTRRNQLALFASDAVWAFPLARAGEPEQLVGRERIARTMGPRWDAAEQAGIKVECLELAVRPLADPCCALSEFTLAITKDGRTTTRKFAHVLCARGGLIGALTEYG